MERARDGRGVSAAARRRRFAVRVAARRGERGVTLMELLVVVVVLGLLVALAGIPGGRSAEGALEQGELWVRDALRTARERAFSTGRAHGVAFDAAGERFIVLDDAGAPVTDPLTKAAYLVDLRAPSLPAGLGILSADFGAAGAAALFDPRGDPLTGGSVTLECDGVTLTVTLDAATGWVGVL